jgi:hypothetical protein
MPICNINEFILQYFEKILKVEEFIFDKQMCFKELAGSYYLFSRISRLHEDWKNSAVNVLFELSKMPMLIYDILYVLEDDWIWFLVPGIFCVVHEKFNRKCLLLLLGLSQRIDIGERKVNTMTNSTILLSNYENWL